ncbi:MAG: Ig-like domain-containing protein [Verrucomicrobiota bacterium]|nr:Ig-like domain-containing protein [Verrucomicrobiota bacterium]
MKRDIPILLLTALWGVVSAGSLRAQSPPAPFLEIQVTGPQQLRLNLSGAPGRIYQFETSSNLVDWAALLTTNSVTSNVEVTASEPDSPGDEFYRALDLGPATGGSPSAQFTLLWPASSNTLVRPLVSTPAGSVVFTVEEASGKTVANQVVNLSSNTNQATVSFNGLPNGDYTAVADAFPKPNGGGVPFEEARFYFTVTGAPVTQTFTMADNAITDIIITPPNPTMAVGGSLQLSATAFDASNEVVFGAAQSGALEWFSASLPVVTVDYTGKLTGVAPGVATIFVTNAADPAMTVYTTVTDMFEIAGLTITNVPEFQPVYVGVGEETNLTVIATNASGAQVPLAASAMVWSSSAATNALVDGTGDGGLVIGLAPGLTTIVASNRYAFLATAPTLANVTLGALTNFPDGVPPPAKGYVITDLGTLQNNPSYLSSLPVEINDYGHIAGTTWNSLSPSNDSTTGQAFIWKTSLNGQMTDLPDLGGGWAGAMAINDADEVVGESIKPVTITSKTQYPHAVLWRNGNVKDLNSSLPGSPNWSAAEHINNEGQVVGSAMYIGTNAPEWENDFLLDLEHTNVTYLWQPIYAGQSVIAINDAGELAGSATFANAFLANVGPVGVNQVLKLSNLPGDQSGFALSINNLDQVAGYCAATEPVLYTQPRAAVWQNIAANLAGTGQATDLGTNGYYSHAACINDLGTVVGDSWPSGGAEYADGHAVLWVGTNVYDLNAYIPTNSGWVLDAATGINNKGQIIGQGTRTNELGWRSFLLTPNSP